MTFVRYLHLLAMSFFVGGQLFLVAAVVRSLRGEDDRERLRTIARRFGWGTLAAIGILVGTGIPLASHFHQWDSDTLPVKLALVAVVAGLVVFAYGRPQINAARGRDLRGIPCDRLARRVACALSALGPAAELTKLLRLRRIPGGAKLLVRGGGCLPA